MSNKTIKNILIIALVLSYISNYYMHKRIATLNFTIKQIVIVSKNSREYKLQIDSAVYFAERQNYKMFLKHYALFKHHADSCRKAINKLDSVLGN